MSGQTLSAFQVKRSATPDPENSPPTFQSLIVQVKILQEVASRGGTAHLARQLVNSFDVNNTLNSIAISGLRGETEVDSEYGCEFFLKGETYWFRLSGLTKDFNQIAILLKEQTHDPSPVSISNGSFQVNNVFHASPTDDPSASIPEKLSSAEQLKWVKSQDESELRDGSIAQNNLTVHFDSPTQLIKSDRKVLFPQPEVFFEELNSEWHRVLPEQCSLGEHSDKYNLIEILDYDLQTKTHDLSNEQFTGFVGYCRFDFQALDQPTIHKLNTLAKFAYYNGVGIKTSNGMGQCWI